jgi:PAS domain S-box-containing protein
MTGNNRNRHWRIASVAALMSAIFAFDLGTGIGVAAAVAYMGAVWLTYGTGSRCWIYVVAAACSVFTIAGLLLSLPAGAIWQPIANRALALGAIWMTALLGVRSLRAEHRWREASYPAPESERGDPATMRLERLEERFRTALESAPMAVLLTDQDGKIVLANKETRRLFGYARDELAGQAVEQLIPERLRRRHVALRRDFDHESSCRRMGTGRELRGLRKDGSEFAVEVGLSQVYTERGLSIVCAMVDITERLALRERQRKLTQELAQRVEELDEAVSALKRSNEDLEQFAYVASHDLQEPLRMVTSYVELLQETYGDALDDEGREFMKFAVDGANRMKLLIRDLLRYSRVGTNEQELVPVDLEVALDDALTGLEVAVKESEAEITRDPLPTIRAVATQISQLFQNLVGNAIKYRGDRRPKIHVGSKRCGRHWEFFVRDNGIGIEPTYFERVFVIFQRLHGREEYSGTGIGLALCKKIVERCGGTIRIESVPGEGTTVYFTLPAVDASVEAEPREPDLVATPS